MRLPLSFVAFVASLLSLALAKSSTGDRVLVVLETGIQKDAYSKFWSSLESRGYSLTFKTPKDDSAELTKFEERMYDHLIMYAPSTKSFSPSLSPQSVLHAQLAGINTLYLLSPSLSPINRDTFREYDLEFTDNSASSGNTLISPFSSTSSSPIAALIYPAASPLISASPANPVLSPSTLSGGPIVFPAGIVHSLGETPYLFPVLTAPRGSYIGSDKPASGGAAEEAEVDSQLGKKGGDVVLGGKAAGVVSAFQTRDNVRIGFVGAGAVVADEFWGAEVTDGEGIKHLTGNQGFAEDITKWLFQETGVLKVVGSTHWSESGGEVEKAEYRKNEQVAFSISLATYNPLTSTYDPLPTPPTDLQLDFTMLDPFFRVPLVLNNTATGGSATTFSANFRAPDRHGVFKFVVEYWRPGYTYIRSSTTTAVVPLRHDEHKRFITGAYPFYGATISVSLAFLLFCGMWLGLGEEKGKKKAQ